MATGIFAFAARLLGISPDVVKVIATLIAIAVALGSAWGGYELIKHRGAEEVRSQIQKENADAMVKGIDAGRSFDDCVAAGGVYDFRRQRCAGATPGAR
ncbi:hypothetical protein [Aquamicrobium soli]|uniref:Uncharacterized protein n=1 Tax=Aquamicrobium soli TaxID=1811518 RepID=A0ABV7K9X1_9HYPH